LDAYRILVTDFLLRWRRALAAGLLAVFVSGCAGSPAQLTDIGEAESGVETDPLVLVPSKPEKREPIRARRTVAPPGSAPRLMSEAERAAVEAELLRLSKTGRARIAAGKPRLRTGDLSTLDPKKKAKKAAGDE